MNELELQKLFADFMIQNSELISSIAQEQTNYRLNCFPYWFYPFVVSLVFLIYTICRLISNHNACKEISTQEGIAVFLVITTAITGIAAAFTYFDTVTMHEVVSSMCFNK